MTPGMPDAALAEAQARLATLTAERSILVCCGSGGVGKTTAAAALAMAGAMAGRNAVVVTIDPAKRLADTLGIGALANEPTAIPGPWEAGGGRLSALMLDTKGTFDALVVKHAGGPVQAERILANRFYRNISGALSGTQEYMAMEKLYELHEELDFDLVVVDTPPTRNALDFLDAPRRLTRFLDHRLYRLILAPTRAYLKAVSIAAQAFMRTVTKVVGADVLGDAVTFFHAFDGMEEGFRARAGRVMELLTAPGTSFVLVASARRDTVEEATFFAGKLRAAGIPTAALVVNRLHPRYGDADGDTPLPDAPAGSPLSVFLENLAQLRLIGASEEHQLAPLLAAVGDAPVVRVPFLSTDVHDLTSLTEVGHHLVGGKMTAGT
jgi:anion-transporting  ArsA/GET3 family ATPase